MKKQLKKLFGDHILEINLDRSQVFKENPAQGTPVLVVLKTAHTKIELDSGTYNCAMGEGELSYRGTRLTPDQMNWLFSQEKEIESFLRY